MKTLSTLFVGTILLLAAVPARAADVCDDIRHLADRWHSLSNYIDSHSDDGKLRKSEIKRVGQDARPLIEPTKQLGTILVGEFKGKDEQRIRALGKQILAAMEELGGLNDDDDWDEISTVLDRMADVIDKVVDQCE
jgi:hypothetical protein